MRHGLTELTSAAGHSFRSASVGLVITVFGVVSGGAGIVLGVAAATPVAAAPSLSIPGCTTAPIALAPGDSGSCTATFSLSRNPGRVFLNVTLSSAAGAPGTEALLDGNSDGLQVTLADTTSGDTYGIGTVNCAGTYYPDATPCSSADSLQPVSSTSITSGNTDVITVNWSFPLQAGNPYQGGTATVALQEEYSGTTAIATPNPSGSVLGVSTSSPTPAGGVLGVSTPTTGAQLPQLQIVLSQILIVLGLGLVFAGLLMLRRERRFGRG
jgi:hypothetical protein